MADSSNLSLPLLASNTNQLEIPINESLGILDTAVQLSVESRVNATPPSTPTEGNAYIIAANPTGAWAGKAGQVARWFGSGWIFLQPSEGWVAYVKDEDLIVQFRSNSWGKLGSIETDSLETVYLKVDTAETGSLSASGAATVGSLTTSGAVSAASATISGAATVGSTLNVTGQASAGSFTTGGTLQAKTVTSTEDTNVGRNLAVGDTINTQVFRAHTSASAVQFVSDTRITAKLFRSGQADVALAATGTSFLDLPLGLVYNSGQIAIVSISSSAFNHEIMAKTEAVLMWTGSPLFSPATVFGTPTGGSIALSGQNGSVLRVEVTNTTGNEGAISAVWLVIG